MRVAVVDLGTNSTRLLIADVEGDRVREVERRTEVTRLGRGVDLTGQLSQEAVADVSNTVAEYVALYREHGADRVVALATSAVRDASNGGAFIAEMRECFEMEARVIGGDEEARLTYLGATSDRPATEPLVVIDIGGGSTELVVGHGAQLRFHSSLQAGVVRHSERHLTADPPDPAALEDLAADVRSLIAEALPPEAGEIGLGIAVAGTPTSLAAIDQALDPYDPALVHGHRLGLETIQRMFSELASVPLAERISVPGLQEGRAPTIVAGIVILVEAMRAFGLDEIEVSEHDMLHGAALETAG